MAIGPVIKFLQAVRNLTKGGAIKTIDQAFDFAKREFGQINDMFRKQINDAFNQGQKELTRITNKPKPSAEIIPFPKKKEGIETLKKEGDDELFQDTLKAARQMVKEREEVSPVMKRLESGIETLKQMKQPGMDLATGLTRTATRKILDRSGIKVPDKVDPIEVFEKNFGGDALMDVKDVAEEMIEIESMGKATKSMDEILEKSGMFNIKKNPDARKGMSDEELEKILKSKKPTEPEEFNTGGRVGLKRGSYLYKGYKGSALEKLMTNPTVEGTVLGYEGIGSLIDILRGFGLFSKGGRVGYAYGTVSKYILGIINSIKKLKPIDAMKEMNEVVAKRGKYKNLNDDEVKKIFDDTNDHIFERDVPADEFSPAFDEVEKTKTKILKDVDEAYGVTPDMKKELDALEKAGAPKAAERFALKQKYPGIDEKLLTDIIDDPDPNRKARVLAELDQAMELMKRDISSDEVIDILKNQSRTKQAEGGLSYLMGF